MVAETIVGMPCQKQSMSGSLDDTRRIQVFTHRLASLADKTGEHHLLIF
jgi:hypothetical protein